VTVLLDANVLIALLVSDHIHHEAAEAWFAEMADDFATCPITQGSVMRFLVRAGQSAAMAQAVLQETAKNARHEFWPDFLPYTEVRTLGVIGHRQVTDAYLAQLARSRGARLATFDDALAKLHDDVADVVSAARD
jgi:uncharacterized protein